MMQKAQKNFFYYSLSVLLVGLLCIPALFFALKILPPFLLAGVPFERRPALSLTALENGSYQQQLDRYLLQRSGIWSHLVWIENSINYHLFGVAGTRSNTTTLVSKDWTLFDRVYINDINGIYKSRSDNIPDTIGALKNLQQQLAARGVPLIVMIHPNKAVLHPEWVSNFWHRSPKPGKRYVEAFLPALQKASIPYIKLDEHFNLHQYQYFLKSGAHMTAYGKCIAAKVLVEKITSLINDETPDIVCSQLETKVNPIGEDLDLVRLLNAYDVSKSIEPVRESRVFSMLEEHRPTLRILIAGTSYSLGVLEQLRAVRAYKQASLLFYNRTQYVTGYEVKTGEYRASRWPLNRQLYDIDFLSKFDAVILEATEARLHQLGFGLLTRYAPRSEEQAPSSDNINYLEE